MTSMAVCSSKAWKLLVLCALMMLLMGLITVQGSTVTFGNMLSPGNDLTVHCTKDGQDQGAKMVSYSKQYSVVIPTDFFGKYVCAFSAPGKATTSFDALNSRCNCNSFSGCVWLAKGEGFLCNYDIIYNWA